MKRFLMIGFILVSFLSVWVVVSPCVAQEKFPTKPITLLIGYPPGGTGDLPLRCLAEFASKTLNQPVVVINKTGASGALALGELKNAKPDGYTIGFFSTSAIISAQMQKVPYHPVEDFEPIIEYSTPTYGLVVKADSPFKTLKDLISYAKANPGKVTYSHAGVGTSQDLVMIQLGEAAKVEMTGIPMGGGAPTITALLGGHVTCAAQTGEWKPYVKSGQLRLLASFMENRMKDFPDVPTLIEAGYNIVSLAIYSVVGPKGVPKEVVQIIHDAFYKAMEQAKYKEVLNTLNMDLMYRNPAEVKKHIAEIYQKSGEILQKVKNK
jgi:tripartite-type tricarboxylate transporter receptor subunit TctC